MAEQISWCLQAAGDRAVKDRDEALALRGETDDKQTSKYIIQCQVMKKNAQVYLCQVL